MSLHELLKDRLPEGKLAFVPKGFEVIGEIAIINIPLLLKMKNILLRKRLYPKGKTSKPCSGSSIRFGEIRGRGNLNCCLETAQPHCTGRTTAFFISM
jgi:hypothetical protein